MATSFVCILAVMVQVISAQVISNAYGPGIHPNGLTAVEAAALAGQYGPSLAPNGHPYGPGSPYGPNALPPNGVPYGPGSPYAPNGLAYEAVAPFPSCGFGLTLSGLAANGGSFAVTSTSPISPNGVSVKSDNLLYEGPLAVTGQMPFLGTVELEGPLPAAGVGAVAYGCGNGNVGINEEINGGVVNAASGLAGPYGPNPNVPGHGYNGYGPFGAGY